MIRPSEIADKAWGSWATLAPNDHNGCEDWAYKPPKAIVADEPPLADGNPPTPKLAATHKESTRSPEMLW